MSDFETVIGLEVHTQIKTDTKIFCSCSTAFSRKPNFNICPVCCGYPGTLPVFNKKVLDLAVRVSLVLNCKVNEVIYFERKNYFYPDLPKNYQISQYKMPLGENGYLDTLSGKKIRINRVHMEEDAGKLIHKEEYSLADYNRAGIPLLEIVSEPDIRSPGDAFEYLNTLKLILQYIKVSDCDMEKGSLRCDANISLRKKGETKLGTKVELKNMNSFKGVRAALKFEVKRQAKSLSAGEKIIQETRLWDENKVKTITMRVKEEAHDYRYFPEPDLLDFFIDRSVVEKEKSLIGELPLVRRERFLKEYELCENDIDVLISSFWLSSYFEEVVKYHNKAQEVSNWMLGPLLEQVNSLGGDFEKIKISAKNFSKIIKYFYEGKVNNLGAKKILSLVVVTDEDVDGVIAREGLIQVSDKSELEKYVDEVVSQNTLAVQEYLEGKDKAIMFLVGQVMKKTRGKANPKVAKEIIERRVKK